MLVTGGSRGIGEAITRAFAASGDRVAIHHSGATNRADQVRASLPGSGHLVVSADITDPVAVHAMVNEAVAALGRLDVVVNNAGVFDVHPLPSTTYDDWQRLWRRTLDVNVLGPAHVTWSAVQHMRRGGRLIYVSSLSASSGEWIAPAYAASKAALTALARSMALMLGPAGIAVTTVAPGPVETDMTRAALESKYGAAMRGRSPFNRVGEVDEVAAAVHYLASTAAEWASGAVLDLNGATRDR